MKILLISMNSIHAIRWIENLKESGHELYWFDITDKGKIQTLESITQITGWKRRKFPYIKGEYWLYKKFSVFYNMIRPFLEVTENEALEHIIKELQPDFVQSFEMQSCSYPIVKTMIKYPNLKWIYNCWGNDIFYYQNFKKHKILLNKVLSRVNFMFSDCQRDCELAAKNGFKGTYLSCIPTGGGYDLSLYNQYRKILNQRKYIIVKGYHHLFGRGLNIVKALKELRSELQDLEIIVFGAHPVVIQYVKENDLPFRVYDRHGLSQKELLELMGSSLIYIGNSISDGMPNTLLEAIIMGAFPIQSNPGNATAEIIKEEQNGLLIQNPESIEEIKSLILKALNNPEIIEKAFEINNNLAINKLSFDKNKEKIIKIYKSLNKCE